MVTITPLADGKLAVRYQREQAADTVVVRRDMPIGEALRLVGAPLFSTLSAHGV